MEEKNEQELNLETIEEFWKKYSIVNRPPLIIHKMSQLKESFIKWLSEVAPLHKDIETLFKVLINGETTIESFSVRITKDGNTIVAFNFKHKDKEFATLFSYDIFGNKLYIQVLKIY